MLGVSYYYYVYARCPRRKLPSYYYGASDIISAIP
jgi:hypothetical protein